MCDVIIFEDLHLVSMAGSDDIICDDLIYDDLYLDVSENVLLGSMI